MHGKTQQVKTGLDVLAQDQFRALQGLNVAVLAHPASVTANLEFIVDCLLKHGVRVTTLFGPEHGILGAAQDMEHVGNALDPKYHLPVHSLYGASRESLMLNPEHLKNVDVLLCDLQDLGSRYYTFAYTIAFALRACSQTQTACWVLDRPNPINARAVEGNLVKDAFRSFVGEYALPNRHGLTMGELAHFFKETEQLSVDLKVVWMHNYRRSGFFEETLLPWVLPSPNMPSIDAALVYPGACLFEGTNLSEGRGTTRPFELVGAPYITNPDAFADKASSMGLKGAILRPCWFKPGFQKHQGKMCGGVQIHITDRNEFHALKTAVALISAARSFDGFDWRRESYEFVSDRLAIDLLMGDDVPRKMWENNSPVQAIMGYLDQALAESLQVHQRARIANYDW